MNFVALAQSLVEVSQSPTKKAISILADLFRQVDFGEAGLLLALCSQKSIWKIHPWLVETAPEELLIPSRLPEPHTLARVFGEMQRIARTDRSAGMLRQDVLLSSLEPPSAKVAEHLLAGKGFVEPGVLEAALAAVRWRIGIPMLPEKLIRRTSEEIDQVWQGLGDSYGHVKDDGYYCQIHKRGDQVLIFVGANLLEQTRQYTEVVEAVRRQVNAETVILEGELVGLGYHNDQVLARRQMGLAARYQVRLFDLLAVNEMDWREQPYHLRRNKRLSLVMEEPTGALCHAQEFSIDSFGRLSALFAQCQREEWEGLVVKQMDARYQSGEHNSACIKLKQVEPIDATIVGYFLKRDEIETFLLALYNEETGQFEACGRTQAGLSPAGRQTVKEAVDSYRETDKPGSVVAFESPTHWVKPLYVYEFLADYRYPSEHYPCARQQTGRGWALHNPVFQSAEPRLDKAAHHTTSIDQFLRLRVEAGRSTIQVELAKKESNGENIQQLGFAWTISDPESVD